MSTDNSDHRDSQKGLMKSTTILSAGTMSSRILGFLRDVLIAKFLGTGFHADAFFVAFRIPNLFRSLVGEGATTAALVPVFSEYSHQKEKREFLDFVSVVFTLGLVVLSGITLFGIVFAPVLIRIIAPGFILDPDKLALTIHLTRIMFPYLILIGMTAYCMGVLYVFKSFVTSAFSPCLLNISIIGSIFFVSRTSMDPVYGLATGVLIGGALQLILHLISLSKRDVKFCKPASLNHPGAKKIGKLLLPRLFGAGVYQLTVFVDTFCASLSFMIGFGGISAIYYSSRIIQLPMGLFGIAMASAALPTLSGFAVKNDLVQFKKTLMFSLKNILFVMLPITAMVMVLSTPIIRILFQRGEFNAYSTQITSMALFFYSIGLFAFGGVKIMVTAFYSLQDTKTPVKVAAVCLGLNLIFNLLLMGPLKIGGIALASSIAAAVNFIILFNEMNRKLGGMREETVRFSLKTFSASVIMGEIVFLSWTNLAIVNDITKLITVGFLGVIAYVIMCYALKVEQAKRLVGWIARKNSKN